MKATAGNKVPSEFGDLLITCGVTRDRAELPILIKVVELKIAGKGSKEAYGHARSHGLKSHSKLDRAWYLWGIATGDESSILAGAKWSALDEAAQRAQVAAWRADGKSWGQISLRIGIPEGATQAAFEAATGLAAQGTRNARGGRFLADEPRYYTGNRKGFGVEAAPGKRPTPEEAAATADEAKSILKARAAAAAKRVANAKKKAKAQPKKEEANAEG